MRHNTSKAIKRYARLFLAFALALLIAVPWEAGYAQRRGGGGGGSFGGGRSFGGGGSFGGSRSSGGSFGGSGSFGGGSRSSGSTGSFGGSRSFGGSGAGSTRSSGSFGGSSSSGGSFGRSGSFGSSGIGRSTSVYNRSAGTYSYGGRSYPVYGGGAGFWTGYSLGYWSSPAWYYYTPFHPAFYVGRPYVGPDGYVYGGGFNWLNFLIGIAFFVFLIWLVVRLFGGGKRVRYTSY